MVFDFEEFPIKVIILHHKDTTVTPCHYLLPAHLQSDFFFSFF